MEIFFSLLIFGAAVYLFFLTNNKIKNIKENIIIEDAKKELESLITEFNSAAARNIELIENKINELQETIKKANNKLFQLDEKIERANKPIIIEKIVEKKNMGKPDKKHKEKSPVSTSSSPEDSENGIPGDNKGIVKKTVDNKSFEKDPEPAPGISPIRPFSAQKGNLSENQEDIDLEELPRSEKLKTLLRRGSSKEELLSMGFLENEINLLSFLIRKNS